MSELTVPLLDLKAQYASIKADVDAAVAGVLQSQIGIFGPEVSALEQEIAAYSNTQHGIGCASGSEAITLALMALNIGPGDEVICPAYTFFATAGSIHRLGAKPVFVDIDPVTFNMDPELTRDAAAKCSRLKAIMPVHLYGQAVDMAAFLKLGEELSVPIIEDAAQAIGARDNQGRRVGSSSPITCLSFYPTKNLGAIGDGGMVLTNDEQLADRVRMLLNHGMKPKYYHEVVGLNARLDAIQAAVLRVKLKHLEGWSEQRRTNAVQYDRLFAEAGAKTTASPMDDEAFALRTPHPAQGDATHIYNQYIISVPGDLRDELREHLSSRNIGSEIYYPLSLHQQECFADLGYGEGDLPNSERAAKQTIALPIYPELAPEQIDHVAATVIEFVGSRSCAAKA